MKHVVKSGRKIAGYVWGDEKAGFSYAFGKPSDRECIAFSGGESPLTKEQAIQRVSGFQAAIIHH